MSNNKPRSSKPYDPNNSFVKKVASRVSGLIPKSTSWLSGWFSPNAAAEPGTSDRVEQTNNEEEHFEDALEKPPPAKRFKVTANQQYVETYNRCQTIEPGEGSSRLVPNNFIDTSAIPGPSGLGNRAGFVASTPATTSVEHLEPKANGDDCSESGESTSGCSSLEPQINRGIPCAQNQSRQNDSISPRKQHLIDEKLNYSYLQNSRSLFLDRTSNSRSNQTVGRRNNPSFCVSTFGTPLFGERGNVNDLILNSPFYSGRTTYGGASSASYRRSLGSASLSSSPANSEKLARHTIKVKPGNSQSTADTSMSQTAKRILATLEQFSTPILDAKRIPVSQEPVLASLGSRKRTRADDLANPQLVLEQPRVPKRTSNKPVHWAKGAPSTSQLTIPTVPDTLIHRRQKVFQEPFSTATQPSSTKADSYELRSEIDDNSATRNLLKMKQKPRLTEKVIKEPEMAPEVNLPQVPLQISTLPTFDISVPAPKPDVPKTSSPSVSSFGSSSLSKPQPASRPSATAASSPVLAFKLSTDSNPGFKLSADAAAAFKLSTDAVLSDASFSFSSPIRVSTASKEQTTLTPVNNFTFSNPLPASAKFMESSNTSVKPRPRTTEASPRQSDSFPGGLKPASQLKAGSVMDILGKSKSDATPSANGSLSLMDKFKPAAGTWECEKCLIRNKSDVTKCAACENPREAKTPNVSESTETKATQVIAPLKPASDFGAQFKMAGGMWECSACMVRNKDSEVKCVACTTAKPGAAPPPKPAAATTSFSGWGDKFKPPSNTWECSVCMVRNGSELSACQSCSTKKPGSIETTSPPVKSSWGDQFKKPEGSWSCGDCMVTNKSTDLNCVACSAKKPGSDASASPAKPSSQFSFGITPSNNSGSAAPAFSFGIPKDNNEGSEGEKSGVSSSTGFKLGDSKPAASATFSFGVPPPSTSASASPASSGASSGVSMFGSVPSAASTTNPAPVEKKPAESAAPEAAKPTFSFGVPAASAAKPTTSMFSFSPASTAPAETTKPTSSTGSPLGGKRKLGDDAPSSSAPFKFGSGGSPAPQSQAKPVVTSTSSVSSTSGPVFSFSSGSNASALLTAAVTSTANGQNAVEAKSGTTNSLFAVAAPASSSPKPAISFGASANATKDESVSSTWKPPSPRNATNVDGPKPAADTNGAPAAVKTFSFGSNVSSSSMAFGANASSAAPAFSFGPGASDKTAATSKAAISFGSTSSSATSLFSAPASTAPLFGSGSSTSASATPAFGSANHVGFGSLTSPANPAPAFQATNSSAPSFSAPVASAFSSSFSGASEEKKEAFSFSAPPAKKSAGFAFSAPEDTKKVFSFGQTASDDSKKSAASFSFTAAAPSAAPNSFPAAPSSVFTFGAAAPAPASNGPAKPDFAFGGNQQPSFPSFNSQPASSTAGFSFGGATPSFGSVDGNAAPAPTPFGGAGSFNSPSFGTASPQPSGFNFSAGNLSGFGTQAQPASGAFNFSADPKPSFFSATPSQDPSAAPGPRRIKRATRRVPPK
ncbi:nuclear pore complex protein Nup153-like [Thrips palmi]|uniref:Nuclear pore complex protein Nup153 n=1 Tax=Thrips palmi TaxID=161013 RepID=A0A6P8ZHP0_THRPL|nr:nuclear pore complex protein Nup153-like [Thrips palmi]